MKLVIVGAGQIGANLADALSKEKNDVYLVESSEDVAREVSDKLDVKVIIGNGSDPQTLLKAQVQNADMVLAVTTSDETNLIVCSIAASFGAVRKIARIRNTSLSKLVEEKGFEHFHIDNIINPELVAAQSIVRTLQTPGASDVADFADGRILLRGFDVPEHSPLCGMKIGDLREEDFPWPFLIVSILRADTVMIPKGDAVIEANDKIYVLLPKHSLVEFLTFIDPDIKMPKKVIVYGATNIGQEVARNIGAIVKNVILLDENRESAENVAESLENIRVIHGSAAESQMLTESGVEAADVFIATSNSDHSNLISAVLAKKMGAKIAIIITQQSDYIAISDSLGIDSIINPHHLAVEQILHLVRGKGISSVSKLLECDAEALEFIPEEGSLVTQDILKNIRFPKNSIIGAVSSGDEINLADGNTKIKPGDHVIVFCENKAVKKLQELFTNS
ncbi:MAG: Trk system potassium transporter TrkA [Candidatus Omnitrophica bacterium]|nr:Trk system potassium transporter TrkA [Candidatus Omnitrophota bacterium]